MTKPEHFWFLFELLPTDLSLAKSDVLFLFFQGLMHKFEHSAGSFVEMVLNPTENAL